jgi:hypothetical protein
MTERSTTPYYKATPEMERKIRECTDPNEIQQLLAQLMAERGVQTRGSYGTYDRTLDSDVPSAPSASAAAAPVESAGANARCFRVIYPAGNNRFELFGNTEQELDEQEAKIRAMYR